MFVTWPTPAILTAIFFGSFCFVNKSVKLLLQGVVNIEERIMISTLALLMVAVCMPIALAQTSDTCRACNCQFSNVQVLSQAIDERINAAMMNEPLIRLFGISVGSSSVSLYNVTDVTTLFGGAGTTTIDTVSRSPTSEAANGTNNLIAYRPSFTDLHGSGLGALFFNMFGIFPCLEAAHRQASVHLPCFATSAENDGFNFGQPFILAADVGNDFNIFSPSSSSTRTLTIGLAIPDCPELTTSCLPTHLQLHLGCFLPRQFCA